MREGGVLKIRLIMAVPKPTPPKKRGVLATPLPAAEAAHCAYGPPSWTARGIVVSASLAVSDLSSPSAPRAPLPLRPSRSPRRVLP